VPVLEVLEFLLDGLSLDLVSGQIRVRGFAVEMWDVFERFVVNALASRMRARVQGPQVKFGYDVMGEKTRLTAKSISLDALIEGPHTVVLDAKWKEGIVSQAASLQEEGEVLELEGLRIRNADLFQVVAYGRHRAVQAQASLLVYPVLEAESVCRRRRILDFVDSPGERRVFPVFLVGILVGETLHECIGDFVETVQEVVADPTVAAMDSHSQAG
jgi:5-methylcytosine-specific restriction endonuclease McrBC regulatory subunit McrC